MTVPDSGSDRMFNSTAKTLCIFTAVRNFISGKKTGDCAILQSPDGNRQTETNMAPRTKPSRGGADFDRFVQKGGFGSFKINPVMGIKGQVPTCREASSTENP